MAKSNPILNRVKVVCKSTPVQGFQQHLLAQEIRTLLEKQEGTHVDPVKPSLKRLATTLRATFAILKPTSEWCVSLLTMSPWIGSKTDELASNHISTVAKSIQVRHLQQLLVHVVRVYLRVWLH